MRRGTMRRGLRPTRTWYDVSGAFAFGAVSTTSVTNLINLQAPAATVNLSSDPVQDLTLLRLVGQFEVALNGATRWTLALLVQDVTWTPSSTFATDADKRILWSMTYDSVSLAGVIAGFTQALWAEPGYLLVSATEDLVVNQDRKTVSLDIKPTIKIQPGQSLVLVAYEEVDGGSITVTSENMRLLFQRTGR